LVQARLFRFPNGADRLPQPHASATAVFVDELDALTGQYVLDQTERSWIPSIATYLNIRNRISMKTGRRGQVSDGPI
jgi:hypothetical protein